MIICGTFIKLESGRASAHRQERHCRLGKEVDEISIEALGSTPKDGTDWGDLEMPMEN